MFIRKTELHLQWKCAFVSGKAHLCKEDHYFSTQVFAESTIPQKPNVITTNDFQIDFCPFDNLLPISHGHIFILPSREPNNELEEFSELGFKVSFTKYAHFSIVV